jgi:hypothetical protein
MARATAGHDLGRHILSPDRSVLIWKLLKRMACDPDALPIPVSIPIILPGAE